MNSKDRNEQGFTMIEMLIALLATTMLMGTLTTGILVMSNSYSLSYNKIDTQYQAQTTLNTFVETFKYAEGISSIYQYVDTTDNGTDDGVWHTRLTESGEQSVHLVCITQSTTQSEYVYMYLKGDELYSIQEAAGTLVPGVPGSELSVDNTHLLATNVSEMKLTPLNGNFQDTHSVGIKLIFKEDKGTLDVSSRATMRNK